MHIKSTRTQRFSCNLLFGKMLAIIFLVLVLILVLGPDIVVQPPPPVQETANRTREMILVVAGERVFPVQLQQVTGRTAFGDGVWYYRGADGGAYNDPRCCYSLEPREESNHCRRREEIVSSSAYKILKNCVA